MSLRCCQRRRGLLLGLPALLCLGLTTLLRRRQCRFRAGLRITPGLAVTQHCPAAHQDLACQGDDRLLLAALAAAGEPLVEAAGPGVVTDHAPGAFDQHLPKERRATL